MIYTENPRTPTEASPNVGDEVGIGEEVGVGDGRESVGKLRDIFDVRGVGKVVGIGDEVDVGDGCESVGDHVERGNGENEVAQNLTKGLSNKLSQNRI